MLVTLISCEGCEDDPKPTVVGPARDFGPPLFDVIFLDGQDYVATVEPDESNTEKYLARVGVNQPLSTPGIGVLYQPSPVASADYEIVVYDYATTSLNLFNGDGEITYMYDNILADYYDVTETKLAYVRILGEDTYELQTSRYGSSLPLYHLQIVSYPYHFASRPSFSQTASRALIAVHNYTDSTVNHIKILTETGTEVAAKVVTAIAPQFSTESDDYVAYIEAPSGPELANYLVIVDGGLDDELYRFNFTQYGEGASSFSWSTAGDKIALYSGAYGPDPKIVIIDVFNNTLSELDLGDYSVTLGSGNDMIWAFPEWNNDDTALVFPGKVDVDGQTKFHIVKYDFLLNTAVQISDMGTQSTHPHWRKYMY
jgi:hypothetical protein